MQTFLPFSKGRVVAACLTPRLNPQAPRRILVGDGPKILMAARLLAAQREQIPVFLKRGVGSWEFVGQYVVAGSTEDRAECAAAARSSGREDAIAAVIELTAATP